MDRTKEGAKNLALIRDKLEKDDYINIIETLVKMIDEGVYIVDSDGKGLFYNEAMAKIEDVHVNDVLGKEFQDAFPGVELSDSTLFRALKKKETSKKASKVMSI